MIINDDNEDLEQNIRYCFQCRKGNMQRALSETESISLKELREGCRTCKHKEVGIYKFDAIFMYIKEHQNIFAPNRGKKPIIDKKHGDTIEQLRAEGKTIKEIGELLGIHRNTVSRILKERAKAHESTSLTGESGKH